MANEKRLIDANELMKFPIRIDHYDKVNGNEHFVLGIESVLEYAEHLPTVDAVEVVRCKDCVSYAEQCPSFGYCYHWDYEQGMSPNQVDGDDFCSYGERKDND